MEYYLSLSSTSTPGPDLPARIPLGRGGGFSDVLGRDAELCDVVVRPHQGELDALAARCNLGRDGKGLRRETVLSKRHLLLRVGEDRVLADCLGRTWINGKEIAKKTMDKNLAVGDVICLGAPEFGCCFVLKAAPAQSNAAALRVGHKHCE